MPLRRGKGRFKAKGNPLIINLELLNVFSAGSKVDFNSLVEKRLIDKKDALTYGVKVLGNGKLEKKLTIDLPISKSAARQVEKLGERL